MGSYLLTSEMRELIEQHYLDNFDTLVVRLSRQAGSPENAEDIVQTAYERALRYQDSFNPEIQDFSVWFNSILRQSLVAFKREEMNMGMVVDREVDLDDAVLEYEPQDEEESSWIDEAINKVQNINHRNILFLHFKRDYKPSEIVKVIEETPSNIEKILVRFRKEMVNRYGKTSS